MTNQDEDAIRHSIAAFADTWNRHDMSAFAALFAEDGDCVNAGGTWWQGRAEIERAMTATHAAVFRESHLTNIGIWIRFVRPDVAIVHTTWELHGMLGRDGQPLPRTRQSLITWTMTKTGETWLIDAFQNTDIVPPPADILR